MYFEAPFWVGVYERLEDHKMEVCKVVFGAEPKSYDVYAYFLNHWNELLFSPPVETENKLEHKINPKRLQRMVNKQLEPMGVGTKAQQALKLQQQEGKLERKINRKRRTEEEKQH